MFRVSTSGIVVKRSIISLAPNTRLSVYGPAHLDHDVSLKLAGKYVTH